MARYFRTTSTLAATLRSNVMAFLGQPDGKADEPWSLVGDFTVADSFYLGLMPHQTEDAFWQPVVDQALQLGVEEITEAEYLAAKPQINL